MNSAVVIALTIRLFMLIRGQTIIFTEVMKCLKVPLSFAIILLNMIMMGEKAGIFGPGISKGRLKKGGNAYFIMTSHQDQ
jgi:hypothetical protein